MSDFFGLAKRITRAAFPQPEAEADPMDAPWDYLMEYEADPIQEQEKQEPYPNQNFD